MDKTYKRHNRRSHPDLQLFTVQPLTAIPSDVEVLEDDDLQQHGGKSYLTSRSLPQTPSILSRSNSRSRSSHWLSSKSAHTFLELNDALLPRPDVSRSRHHSRTQSARIKASDSRDWLLQTASALTSSSAESKGQTWLATRSSSTSLVNTPFEFPESAYRADDEFSPTSVRHVSRPQSRLGSRFGSRRGSKVGLVTPIGIRTPGEREEQAGYFDNVSIDFVDSEVASEDSDDGEVEVRQLVWGRARGWVDWAVGWMDFREEGGPGEISDGEEQFQQTRQASIDYQLRNEKRRRLIQRRAREDINKDSVPIPPAPEEGGGIIGDVAWLVGVARSAW